MANTSPTANAWRVPSISEISLALLLGGAATGAVAQEAKPIQPSGSTPAVRFEAAPKQDGPVIRRVETVPAGEPPPGAELQIQPGAAGQPIQTPANSTRPLGRPTPSTKAPPTIKSTQADVSSRPSKRKDSPANELQFNFKDADWEDVLTWFADETGRTLLMDTKPTSKFNYIDSNKYTVSEALDILNNVLLAKGFILVRRDNFLQVVELKDGIPPHLVQRVPLNDLPKYGKTELVRVLIPLEGLVAEKAKEEVEQLKGPFGTINALPSVNQLQVVDIAKNVQQIYDVIREVSTGGGKADLRSFHLQYVSVLEVEKNVRDILGMPARDVPQAQQPGATGGQPGGGFQRRFGGGGGGDDRGARMREMMMQGMQMMGGAPGGPGGPPGANPLQAMMGGQQRSTTGPFVATDERTNTLFVATTPDNLAKVAMVVKELDVPQNNSGDLSEQTPRFEVYPVAAGMADGLAKVLDQMFNRNGDTKINAHPDGKALIVHAVPREHKRISAILDQLKTESVKVEVIQLRKLEAASTAALVKSLLGEKKEDDNNRRMPFFFFRPQQNDNEPNFGPTVEADTGENRLVIRGTEIQISEIRELLVKLGEPIVPGASGSDLAKYRVIPLQGYDPVEAANRLKDIWGKLDGKNPLKIEVMDDRPKGTRSAPPPRDEDAPPQRKSPNGERTPKRSPAAKAKGNATTLDSKSQDDVCLVAWRPDGDHGEAVEVVKDDEPIKSLQKNEAQAVRQPKSLTTDSPRSGDRKLDRKPDDVRPKPVTIVFGPDNLTLASDDPKALAMVENIIRSILPTAGKPSKSAGFALFYLRSADASDMATMIDEALYGQKSPFSLNASDPQQARIIPDTRTNALLVVGPPGEQRKVEMLLEKLDRDDAPESDIQPKPKPISLQHAVAADIAKEIKDVYADRMMQSGSGQGQSEGGGFPGFMFGGGRNRRSATGKGKIAVSYDETTNTVLVAAPKDLFDEIEAFAKDLDDKAKSNRRVARIITLKNADPDVVAAALGNLLGVKTTAKAKPGAPGQGQDPNSRPGDPNDPRNQGMGRFGSGNQGGFNSGGSFRGGGGGGPGGGGGGFRRRFGGGEN